ncbi:MAG: 1-deoxy-D-xylulose-5-phosphate reductoisomerase [Bryobacteraceae bacterium]|nr:1-deoxy-D-xylulose-5-phosphate reductoisomerase [Bryobacteraceae bacterium]
MTQAPVQVTVLGSTGSIGVNTLNVLRTMPDRFSVYALAAGTNFELLASQIQEFRPHVVVVASEAVRRSLLQFLEDQSLPISVPDVLTGPEALVSVATAPEIGFVMSAIVGVAGLEATYQAVQAGKKVGLANKEVLVASGELVMAAAAASGTELLPVDSEHNGAHQCLRAGRRAEATRLILTASGGPFRTFTQDQMSSVTPAQALRHPTWKMGNRITIDSATMMNKGFEVIEAGWLFGFAPAEIGVVVHPQSTVHALVEFNDGSVIAQVCATDMRMPIQYALTYPDREAAPVPRYDFSKPQQWDFTPPDFDRFPCLRLAYQAFAEGGSATCVLNAADEIAVEAFLQEEISFPQIAATVEETLARLPRRTPQSVGEVLEIDAEARHVAQSRIARRPVAVPVTA